jgi:hypothetical protein
VPANSGGEGRARQARRVGSEWAATVYLAVVHVTGYMLALMHQGQKGFRVWVTEPGGKVQSTASSRWSTWCARAGAFAKCHDFTWDRGGPRVLTPTVCFPHPDKHPLDSGFTTSRWPGFVTWDL